MASVSSGWYVDTVAISPIVMEASTSEDREYMRTMSKDDIHQINGTLSQGLYKTILDRKSCDFGDIPSSKGDIEKCKYYDSTVESLKLLAELMVKNEIPTTDVDVVKEAIANIRRFKSSFVSGFQLNNDYLIIFYNTIVMAVIDSTSMIIARYMSYIVGPNQVRYDGIKSNDKNRGINALDMLQRFNNQVKIGHFETTANYLLDAQRKNFTGEGIVIAGVVVAALASVIPITRGLIYLYYESRVKMSDYLNMQADFLELNKLGVQASSKSAQQKKNILKKQEQIILKCRRRADKLNINNEDIGVLAKKRIEDDNAAFSLKNIEKQMYSNKVNGTGFTIV